MEGMMCQWRGRCAHEEEDVPMKRKHEEEKEDDGRCGHEGEDAPVKRKMCQ